MLFGAISHWDCDDVSRDLEISARASCQFFPAFILAIILTACQPSVPAPADPAIGQRRRLDVTIELTTLGLIYNGKHLDINAPISTWVDVLGPGRESSIGGILVSDELGIRTYTKSLHDDRVNSVAIILRREPGPTYSSSPKPGVGLEPLKLYTGKLMWNGAAFDKNTTVGDLQGSMRRTIHCVKGTGNCTASRIPGQVGRSNYIAFQADSRLGESPIYEVSVGRHFASRSEE